MLQPTIATFQIVMVTKDRPALFEQSVQSLYRSGAQGFSLTVVDDCSKDQGEIERLRRKWGFDLLMNTEITPLGASKNKALDGKSGLCYLTDNDVYFTPDWLPRLLEAWHAKAPEVKLLGGGCHPYLRTNRIDQHDGFQIHYKDAISGWSWLLEHETWEQYGPLDANALGSGQSEDWAFCQRIKADGFEVASIWPEVVIHCGVTNTEGKPAPGAETFQIPAGVLAE